MLQAPKVFTSAPFYISGVPVGGCDPDSSACPFCLLQKWMPTGHQAMAAGKANAEFHGIMLLAVVNIVVFLRFGEPECGTALAASLMRGRMIRALRLRLVPKTKKLSLGELMRTRLRILSVWPDFSASALLVFLQSKNCNNCRYLSEFALLATPQCAQLSLKCQTTHSANG